MQILCTCGRSVEFDPASAGAGPTCPHCGAALRVPSPHRPAEPDHSDLQSVDSEHPEDDFVLQARLARQQRMLVTCGACEKVLTVSRSLAGRARHCPACGSVIRIPPVEDADDQPRDAPGGTLEALPGADDYSAAQAAPEAPPAGSPADPAETTSVGGVSYAGLLAVAAICLALGAVAGYLLAPRSAPTPAEAPIDSTPAAPSQPDAAGDADAPQPRLLVRAATISPLAGPSGPVAKPGRTFVRVDVEIAAESGALTVTPAAPMTELLAGDQRFACLGRVVGPGLSGAQVSTEPIAIDAGRTEQLSLLFETPAGALPSRLSISGVALATIPPPSLAPPAPLAPGRYVPVEPIALRVGFANAVAEAIRSDPAAEMLLAEAGDALAITLGTLTGRAEPAADGAGATLSAGTEMLEVLLRSAGEDRLVLYLDDGPFAQIVYRRVE